MLYWERPTRFIQLRDLVVSETSTIHFFVLFHNYHLSLIPCVRYKFTRTNPQIQLAIHCQLSVVRVHDKGKDTTADKESKSSVAPYLATDSRKSILSHEPPDLAPALHPPVLMPVVSPMWERTGKVWVRHFWGKPADITAIQHSCWKQQEAGEITASGWKGRRAPMRTAILQPGALGKGLWKGLSLLRKTDLHLLKAAKYTLHLQEART